MSSRRRIMLATGDIDYSHQYLTLEALEPTTFYLSIPSYMYLSIYTYSGGMSKVAYSIDNGLSWTTITRTVGASATAIATPVINAGEKVLWKGLAARWCSSQSLACRSIFSSTGAFKVYGNVLSLLYWDDFSDYNTIDGSDSYTQNTFWELFANSKIVDASNLILPLNTKSYCYAEMFLNCLDLVNAPTLPATLIASGCYSRMFKGCTKLKKAPDLLSDYIDSYSYYEMFAESSVNYIKCLATTLWSDGIKNWVKSLQSAPGETGTFIKHPYATFWTTGDSGIPSGWTVIDSEN